MPDPLLVIEHASFEPMGLLASWLSKAGVAVLRCMPYVGDRIPESLDGFSGLVVMGGPQSAHEPELKPWVGERALIASAVEESVPFLGVCLGAQLLAVACGGEVAPMAKGNERGVLSIDVRDGAEGDLWLGGLHRSQRVVQWHGDEVTVLPPNSTWLASSAACQHQAFRVGERAWGLQFHPEATPEILAGWAEADGVRADRECRQVAALDLEGTWRGPAERFARLVI